MPHHAVIGYLVWAMLFGALFAWEGVTLIHANDTYPSLSEVVRALMDHPAGRWVLFTLWLWIGWHTFVRGWHFLLREPR